MYDQVIKLVKEAVAYDDAGDKVITKTERQVFAEYKSASQSEFYQANALGMKPECKFVLADALEYQGEKIVRYTPFGSNTEQEFNVLRTYTNGGEFEIVCKRGLN